MAMSNQHPARGYFDRAKALAEEIAERQTDLKALYEEAKADEIDVAVLKGAVRDWLKPDSAEKRRDKERAIQELLEALGEFANSPLGQAATGRAA